MISAAAPRTFARYWLPVLAWAASIFGFSTDSFSAPNTGSILEPLLRFLWPTLAPESFALIHHLVRKSAHVTEYMILGLLFFRALRRERTSEWRAAWAWTTLAFVAAYAGLDEFHQSFVPSRTSSAFDVGWDCLGGALGQALIFLRRRARP